MNKIQMSDTTGPIASKDFRNTEIFKSMEIDFWCESTGITKEQNISAQKNISCQEIEDLDLDALIDHITGTHHQFTKKRLLPFMI
jgi:iron-sulfur cluster repair protein YtfE (RIC family)